MLGVLLVSKDREPRSRVRDGHESEKEFADGHFIICVRLVTGDLVVAVLDKICG